MIKMRNIYWNIKKHHTQTVFKLFSAEDFDKLFTVLNDYLRGLKCLKTHWKTDKSPINISRSNQCWEHANKVLQDLHDSC